MGCREYLLKFCVYDMMLVLLKWNRKNAREVTLRAVLEMLFMYLQYVLI